MESLKLLVVGDGAVGKSCLLIRYSTGGFPSEYVPTVFDNYANNVMVDGKPYVLGLWDTAGQEDYDRLRPLSYPQTDVFLVCFSVENRDSFENVLEKWIPELDHHMPHIPRILVGCKNDLRRAPADRYTPVTVEEAKNMAKKCRCDDYIETSSLEGVGVHECFQTSLRAAVSTLASKKTEKKRKGLGFGLFGGKGKDDIPNPPVMPPAGLAPWVEVETSVFADQWGKMIQAPCHTDVEFILEGQHRLRAHRILLCSASHFFARVLGVKTVNQENQLDIGEDAFSRDALNSGAVPGITQVYERAQEAGCLVNTVVEISSDIKANVFVHVLEFLYTGIPNFKEDTSEDFLDTVVNVSRIFKLDDLERICVNIRNEEEFLNPSIGTFLNDETGKRMKQLFFASPKLSDITFNVQGTKVYAHKVVLAARCDVMAAMFSGNFSEGGSQTEVDLPDTPPENFMALLEYLYTDHAPIEEGDSVGIMVLADQYCQPRLVNLCELYITKEVDRSCSKCIETADIDVIGLLLMSQLHNAKQLVTWCLHFISSNYTAFRKRSEFNMLTGENLEHVEEHQWPPLDYLKEVEDYEKLVKKKHGKCATM